MSYKIYEFDGMKDVYVGQTPIFEQAEAIANSINEKNKNWTTKAATIKYYDVTFETWMSM